MTSWRATRRECPARETAGAGQEQGTKRCPSRQRLNGLHDAGRGDVIR